MTPEIRKPRRIAQLPVNKAGYAKEAELKGLGYKILKDRPYGDTTYGTKEKQLNYLRADATAKAALTPAGHKNCPGRAAYVDTDYSGNKVIVTEACVDWKANGHAAASGAGARRSAAADPAKMTPAQKKQAEKERQQRRTHMACIKAGKAAEVVRRRFVSETLARTTLPKGIERYVTEAIVTGYHRIEPHTTMFGELTGVDTKTARRRLSSGSAQSDYVKALGEKVVLLGLLAFVAAEREDNFAPNSWERPGDERLAWLRFLVANGYAPSLIEKVQLGEAKASEVLDEADRIKAAAKA